MKRLTACVAALALTAAAYTPAQAAVTRAMMAGNWAATLQGQTGCGNTSMYVTFNLTAAGTGLATIQGHSTGCADSTTTGNPIQINTITGNGSGSANLSCGSGCGWQFKIQVASDGRTIIMTDVDAGNPGNTVTGIAMQLSK